MHSGAGWIASLRHKAVDDAMEYNTVVEMLLGQLLNALDMLGREIRPQLDGDAAILRVEIKEMIVCRSGGRGAERGDGRGGKKQTAA